MPRRATLLRRAARGPLTVDESRRLLQSTEEEEAFLQKVRAWALLNGWLWYHTRRSDGSDEGFYDVVALHRDLGRLLFIELKAEEGQPTAEQYEWGEALCHVLEVLDLTPYVLDYRLWRPSDWPEIERTFRWNR